MSDVTSSNRTTKPTRAPRAATPADGRERRRLTTQIKTDLRNLRNRLSSLNRQVGARLDLKEVDLDCLDLISRSGSTSPTALARSAGLHPATITGVLDRLERAGWIARQRHDTDRRSVTVQARPDRGSEIFGLFAGMNSALDQICATYDPDQLTVIADFLRRSATAGENATRDLALTRPPARRE